MFFFTNNLTPEPLHGVQCSIYYGQILAGNVSFIDLKAIVQGSDMDDSYKERQRERGWGRVGRERQREGGVGWTGRDRERVG